MAVTFDQAVSAARLRPFQFATFLVCMLVLVCDGIDLQLLGLVAPVIIDEWGVDRGSFGWAMSAALVGMAFGAWGGGMVGDRIGRRNALVGAALVFGLATIAASQASTIPLMTGLRFLGGLGFGAAFPNSLALASEWLPERWRSYAITTLSVGTPAGGSVAAALAPDLLAAYGWRGTFVVFGIATVLLIVLILGLLRDSPSFLFSKGRDNEARKMALKVVGHDVDLIADDAQADSGQAQGASAASIGVFHSSNTRLNWGVGIGFAASTLVAYAIISWATTFLTAAGFTLDQALSVSFLVGITSIAGALAAGDLSRRFGSKAVMFGVSIALVICIGVLAAVLHAQEGVPSDGARLLVKWLTAGVSGIVSVGIATIYVMMTLGYPQTCRSAGIGFGMLTGRVGGILASFGGGYLIDLGQGSLLPFFAVLLVGAVLVASCAFVVDRHVEPSAKG